MINIIFVCTGNTCRSPMAESIFKVIIKRNHAECKVSSRGLIINPIDAGINPISQKVLNNHKIKFNNRKPHKLTPKAIKESSYIITMTETQKQSIIRDLELSKNEANRCLKDRIFSLKELVNGVDIPDPYGYGEKEYEAVYDLIYQSLERLYVRMFAKNN